MCTENKVRKPHLLNSHPTLTFVTGLTWSGTFQKLLEGYALMVIIMLFDNSAIFLENFSWSSICSIIMLLNTASYFPLAFHKLPIITFLALCLSSASMPTAL